ELPRSTRGGEEKWERSGRPAPVYSIAAVAADPGAGHLIPSPALLALEEGFEAVFYPPGADPELADLGADDDEDWDPWDEDRAERWLGYVLEQPAALDSVDILEDVAHAVSELAADR